MVLVSKHNSVLPLIWNSCLMHGDQIALEDSTRSLTYREFENEIALFLEQFKLNGVESGEILAIHSGKSVRFVIAMLAAFIHRCIVVPIDKELPNLRKRLMCEAAGVHRIIELDGSAANEFDYVAPRPIFLNIQPTVAVIGSKTFWPEDFNFSPAYIFFTSGTTGRPKGVLGSHRALAHFIGWYAHELGLKPGDRVAQLASISFDAMLKDVLTCLCSGATLVFPHDRPYEDPQALCDFLYTQKITLLQTVPSVLSSLLNPSIESALALSLLKMVCLAGEPLSGQLVNQLRKRALPNTIKINSLYGLTETTILKAIYRIPTEVPDGVLPVGVPISDTKLEIRAINKESKPEDPGQLYIITPYVTLGSVEELLGDYQPEEWQKWRDYGNKVEVAYPTGDLARYRSDGQIELLGRIDQQIKINGIRINPIEVAEQLLLHPEVQASFALPVKDAESYSLIAYVVLSKGGKPTEIELRNFVAQRLPTAFVPSRFVVLDRLPVNANGKIDTTRLPPATPTLPESGGSSAIIKREGSGADAPTAAILFQIWTSILKKRVDEDVDANFFSLGGHSLLAVQLVARVRKVFGCQINLQKFFTVPTISELIRQIRAVNVDTMAPPPLKRLEPGMAYRLSLPQRRLWLLYQLDPKSNAYNMSGFFELPSSAEVEDLQTVLGCVFARHEALRAVFFQQGDEIFQSFNNCKTPDIAFHQVSSNEELVDLRSELAAEPFELGKGPLVRMAYIEHSSGQRGALMVVHHIVCDAWSWNLLTKEILTLLNSPRDTQDLAPVEFQYSDFIEWQRAWLRGDAWTQRLKYWTERLAPPFDPIFLTPDKSVSNDRSAVRGNLNRQWSISKSEAVRSSSSKCNVTPFMFLLAAFKILLSKVSGKDDIIVGSDTSGRSLGELDGIVGFFVGTVALRTNLSGDPTFQEILDRVRSTVLGAYLHQDIPFDSVVEALNPVRRGAETPIFQVMFRSYPFLVNEDRLFEKLTLDLFGTEDDVKFALTVVVSFASDGSIRIGFEYDRQLFSESFIDCLYKKYESIVDLVCSDASVPLGNIFAAGESRTYPWTDFSTPLTRTPPPAVLASFLEWVRKTPEVTAIRHNDIDFSYQRVEALAQACCEELLNAGCSVGDYVGIAGPCSPQFVACLLGVFSLGCVAIPLDMGLPLSRIERMLKNPAPKVILAPPESLKQLLELGQKVICPSFANQGQTKSFNSIELRGNSPAYVFYTSGSSGQPKAVQGTHGGLSNFIEWESQEFSVGPNDKVLQITSLSFDAVLRELLLPLVNGGSLVIPATSLKESGAEFVKWWQDQSITIIHTVPSVLANLFLQDAFSKADLIKLRVLCLSGEPLFGELTSKIYSALPKSPVRVFNFYGTTECTMIQAAAVVPRDFTTGVCPVGTPIKNTQITVLDQAGRYCGPLEPGEITIRSEFGLCKYLAEEPAASIKIQQNPYSKDLNDQIYRTGDRGRFGPDGTISILGRWDDQVKINGVRVEPTEIAAILSSFPGVLSSVVLGKRSDTSTQLVAFVEASPFDVLRAQALRDHLAKFLNPAAVPSNIIIKDKLPRLPNGKIDRVALLAYDLDAIETYIAPIGSTEEAIAKIWEALLNRPRIGRNDNFFQSGGHSLLATALISRVRKHFAIELPLRTIFENQDLLNFAKCVGQIVHDSANTNRHNFVKLSSNSNSGVTICCVHPISGGIGCYQYLANTLAPEASLIAIGRPNWSGTSGIGTDVRLMAHEYVMELLESRISRPIYLGGWSFGGLVAYEMARQLLAERENIGGVVLFDTYASICPEGEKVSDRLLIEALVGDLSTILGEQVYQQVDVEGGIDTAVSSLLKSGLLPAEEGKDELFARLAIIRAHFSAMNSYKLKKNDCRTLLVLAQDQVRPNGMPELLGWSKELVPNLSVVKISGTHRTILQNANIVFLGNLIRDFVKVGQ